MTLAALALMAGLAAPIPDIKPLDITEPEAAIHLIQRRGRGGGRGIGRSRGGARGARAGRGRAYRGRGRASRGRGYRRGRGYKRRDFRRGRGFRGRGYRRGRGFRRDYRRGYRRYTRRHYRRRYDRHYYGGPYRRGYRSNYLDWIPQLRDLYYDFRPRIRYEPEPAYLDEHAVFCKGLFDAATVAGTSQAWAEYSDSCESGDELSPETLLGEDDIPDELLK